MLPHLEHDLSVSSLKRYGLYLPYLKEKIKQELMGPQPTPSLDIALARVHELDPSLPSNLELLHEHAAQLGLTINEFAEQVAYKLRFRDWCHASFKGVAESLFIKYKKTLTRIGYSALQFASYGLAIELFHELEAREITFEEVYVHALLAGGTIQPTHTSNAVLSDLLDDVAGILLSLPIKNISFPKKVNDNWVIFRLETLSEPILDESTRLQLCLIEGHSRIEIACRQYIQQEIVTNT